MLNVMRNILCTLALILCAHIHGVGAGKILHLTFHRGCEKDLNAVAERLGIDITSIFIQDKPTKWLDGETSGNGIYNLTHDRAQKIWKKHKDFFNSFDMVITSDTAPLARIFLQNGWKKPLIIWVCNRFDYYDRASLDGDFPDNEFYDLFKKATKMHNVRIVSYTPFERYYASMRGVQFGDMVIRPAGIMRPYTLESAVPLSVNKSETFFIPPYLNDEKLPKKCAELGIPWYRGRYHGPLDLCDFKGIIHLPYAWSNLALFENIQYGVPYFIPSKRFILQLSQQDNYFFGLLSPSTIEFSEWYCEENRDLFIYFDSWVDLKKKIKTTDLLKQRIKIQEFAKAHQAKTLEQWKNVIMSLV